MIHTRAEECLEPSKMPDSPGILSRVKRFFTSGNSSSGNQPTATSTQKQYKNLDSDAGFLGVPPENVLSAKPAVVNQVQPVEVEPPTANNAN